ncbi:GAF domain-containing protein [Pleurocapsales cyanobacterium LEGE 06147]|nr:GAF domain-containing protein [Pleurocapsales cyanobacterium LEGE 06147]
MFTGFNSEVVNPKTALTQINSIEWQHLGAELVFTQARSGKYLSFWWELAEEYGLSNEQVIGTSLEEVFTPVEQQAYKQKIRQALKRRLPEQCYCLFECQGQSFAFELVISPILPARGEPCSVLGIGHLLSEAEMSLFSHSRLPAPLYSYQKLLTQISRKIRRSLDLQTIWQQTVDNLGQALGVSRCLILSYSPNTEKLKVEAEYLQPDISSMLGQTIDKQSELYFEQAIQSRQAIAVDLLGPDSYQQKSVLVVSTAYKNEGNTLICLQQCDRYRSWTAMELELVQELAEQVGTASAHAKLYQELEQTSIRAEEASRLKSDFLANTSHELRTPLNGIIGFLKLVIEGVADNADEQLEFLQEAYKSSLHLLDLINDVLDIAKIEAGKMDLELTDVELEDLFENVDNLTHTQAEQKNLNFQIKYPATLTPVIIYGNYKRLLQVMLNLVGNAIKFTHEGGVIVSAELSKKKVRYHGREFPGMVKISVADTGIGVSLEKQDKLFENFFQVDGSRTKAYGGTGLGLAISQKLVEAMGGNISFYSMGEGLGSTVTFTVPLSHLPVIKTAD